MNQETIYSLLSANAYFDVRDLELNRAPLPEGWTNIPEFERTDSGTNSSWSGTGFSARVYQGPNGQIVIAYSGTELGNSTAGLVKDFVSGNSLAVGGPGGQAFEAALLFEQVAARYGRDNITFTGHSLGGGLASLMTAWFDRPSVVFAPAPFEKSAYEHVATVLTDSVRQKLAAQNFVDPVFNNYDYFNDFATREAKVKSYAVAGEVVGLIPLLNRIESSRTELYSSASWGLSYALEKHSIELHAAALLTPAFETSASKLTEALPLLFDEKLYGYKVTNGTEQNLLVKLIRGEVGVRDESNGQVVAAPNALLTHFSNDLGKLDAVGLAKLSQAGQQAVLAQNMEWYYWQGGAYAGSEFATVAGSLLQYNSAEGDGLLTDVSRAQPWVKTWLDAVWADNGNSDYPSFGTRFQQWSLSTEQAVVASARNADMTQIFVGAGGNDSFTGGNLADVLMGGGADTLSGGGGRDVLVGGLHTHRRPRQTTAGRNGSVPSELAGLTGLLSSAEGLRTPSRQTIRGGMQ
ncbi:MAG: hypothetical protein ABI574_10370 [Burkholderiales bacterium]